MKYFSTLSIPRGLILAGRWTLLGYAAAVLLFQSAQMWVAPSVITARWKWVSNIAYAVLPDKWLNATPIDGSGSWMWFRGAYVAILLALFTGYVIAARKTYTSAVTEENSKQALQFVLGISAVALLLLLAARAIFSTDIYSYVWYGRIPALEGGNPYINEPQEYLGLDTEGWMEWEVWQGRLPSVYGPLWTYLAAGATYLGQLIGGKELAIHVLMYRLMTDAAHLINIWLVWQVAGEWIKRRNFNPVPESLIASRQAWQLGAAVTYAWNPLLLFEFGLSGHNDSIMLMFLLLSLLLLAKGWWKWGAVAVAAAAMVKLAALIALPFYLLLLRKGIKAQSDFLLSTRQWLLRSAQATGIVVIISLLLLWPFGGPEPLLAAFSVNPSANLQVNSLGAFIIRGIPPTLYELRWLTSASPASIPTYIAGLSKAFEGPTRVAQQLLSVLFMLFVLWKTWTGSTKSAKSVITGLGWAFIVYFLLGSLWFWPWYVSWVLVPLSLVGPGRLWTAGQILSLSAMLVYVLFPPALGFGLSEHYTGLIIFVPTAAYCVWTFLINRQEAKKIALAVA